MQNFIYNNEEITDATYSAASTKIDSLFQSHRLHKSLVKLLSGIEAHLLLTVVHSSNLDYYRKVTSGTYRENYAGHGNAENIGGLLIKAEAVVHFVILPGLKVDNKVDLLALLYRTHTEESAYVNDADSAKLYVMTDDLGCLTDKSGGRHALDLNGVIRNKTVAALKKLNSGLALTYAGVTEEENTLAVYLDENSVAGDTGCKTCIEVAYYS